MTMRKQTIGVKKLTSNVKVLSDLLKEITTQNIYKDFYLLKRIDTYLKPLKKKRWINMIIKIKLLNFLLSLLLALEKNKKQKERKRYTHFVTSMKLRMSFTFFFNALVIGNSG